MLCCVVAVLQLIWDMAVDLPRHSMLPEYHSALARAIPVYRGIGCMLLIPWLWACNLIVWRKFRINYMYVLDCDVKVSQPPRRVGPGRRAAAIVAMTLFVCCEPMIESSCPPSNVQMFAQASAMSIAYLVNFIVR